ncbi:S-adenosyl-L-methionine-dependent methyltransferase [Diplogelasinospora grovesii]|uniref:S-adenosyl-L-methionine-dependent methyltransferase n=1 Tax=Diplogelasinospora grovesii TaxID=303347 RepID=A0AAN6MYD8_9PEZI|nr:S-adenosyl-L-methionine-dependent methyltransferase [Diplogelasinospora grovesii]
MAMSTVDGPIAAATEPIPEDELEKVSEGWDATSNSSSSIASSVYRHAYEGGRRFHSYKYGRYPLPNDDESCNWALLFDITKAPIIRTSWGIGLANAVIALVEQRREAVKHAMMMEVTDGTLYHCPIDKNAKKIIDVGTGTGVWAIEVAEALPDTQVLGIDLSPIQPDWVPPNCRFLIDDAEEEWVEGDFDMVHMGTMASILKDVPKVLRYAFSALKPGGWLELQELMPRAECDDGTMPPDDLLLQFNTVTNRAFMSFGMDTWIPEKLQPILEKAGFVDIRCIKKKIPVGPWASNRSLRVAGLHCREAIEDIMPVIIRGRPFQALGMSTEESEAYEVALHDSLQDLSRHRYMNFYFWLAQRPDK